MTSSCIQPFEDGTYFDCNIWVPAEPFRLIPSSDDYSSSYSYSGDDSLSYSIDDLEGSGLDQQTSIRLNEEVLAEKIDYTDVQSHFNALANKNHTIKSQDAVTLARQSGLSPSKQDEEQLVESYGEKITWDNFNDWLVSIAHPEDTVKKLCEFFALYDTSHTGFLSFQQFETILSIMGEPLLQEEILKLVKTPVSPTTKIDYVSVAKSLIEG